LIDGKIFSMHKWLILMSRLTAFLGSKEGLRYTYSQKLNVSTRWHPLIAQAKVLLEQEVKKVLKVDVDFSVALLNLYEDGNHQVSWHSDSESDLQEGSPIATLSLGASRTFQLRHKAESVIGSQQTEINTRLNNGETVTEEKRALLSHKVGEDPELNKVLSLGHGDLLVMAGTLQKHWRHRVPQEREVTQPRIVFTFRCVREDKVEN
jgi:alkylated DNA repair dioxygenase AlkB